MTEIAALGLRVDGAEGVERSASALDNLTKSADSAEKAADALAVSSRELSGSQERLISAMGGLDSSLAALSSDIRNASAASAEAAKKSDELARARREEEQATQKARSEASAYASSLKSILDRSDPLAAATRKHADQMKVLERALKDGKVSTEQYAKANDMLEKELKEAKNEIEGVGKSTSNTSALLTRAAGMVAAAFGTIKLTSLIKDAALANSRFEQLGIVMERVGQNVNLSSDQVNRYAKEVEGMGISMTESRNTVIRMIQAQMDLSKASELARLAQDAAVIANTNSSDALGRLIYGLQSGQVEILRNMGLNVNFANSYTALAKEMDITVAELSEADKAQARMNAVMQAGVQIAGTYEASMDSASKQLGSTTRYVEDLGVMIGGLFSDTAKQAVFGYSDSLKELHGTVKELSEDGSLERWSENLADAINLAMINVKGFTAVAVELGKEAKGTADNIGMLASALRSAGIELPTMEGAMRRAKEEMEDAALWAVFLAKAGLNAITGNLRGTISAWNELQKTLKDRSAERQAERLNKEIDDLIENSGLFGFAASKAAKLVSQQLDDLMENAKLFGFSAKEAGGSVSSATKEQEKAIKKMLQTYEQQIALFGKTGKAAEVRYQLEKGLIEGINKEQSKRLLMLAEELDMLESEKELMSWFEDAQSKRQGYTKELNISVDALSRELVALKQGEAAHKAVTRELAIEAAVRDMQSQGIKVNTDELRKNIEAQYDLQQELETLKNQANPLAESWQAALERIDTAFVDLWKSAFDGFKDFSAALKNAFFQLLAELAHRATTQKILISFGMAGTSTTGMAGGLGNILSLSSMAKTLQTGAATVGSWVNTAGTALSNGLHQLGGGFSSLAWGMESAGYSIAEMFGASGMGAGQASMLGGAATAGAGWAGGKVGSDLGLAITGKEGSGWGATGGAAIGAYVGSIFPVVGTMLGAAIGGLVGGVVDSVFGSSAWNTTDTGINLGFDEEGFLPEQYERQKKRGGLFSSTKRRYRFSDLPDETAGMLEDAYASTVATIGQMYDAIGVAVDQAALEAVRTGSLMINAKATQEEMEDQIGTWFFELSEALVGSVDSSLDTATLERLAGSLTAVNNVFRAMNLRLFEASKSGAEMASSLIDVAGGLENFAAATDYYYQNFYSETERANALVEQYTSVVGSFNEQFGAAISKRSDLRDFVEALDLTTTAGQNAYAAAMNLAPALVGLDEAMQIATQGVHDIAGDIAGMFASTYERIMLDGMKSDQERYDYFKSQADAISDAMDHIADPAVIKSMMQDYDRILNEAYRSLSAESQDIMREDILKTLRLVEDKSLDLIQSAPNNQQQVVETLAQSVTDLSAQQKQNTADQKQTNAQLQASLQDIANQLSGVVAQFGGYVQAMPGSFNVQITIPEVG